MDRLRRGSLDSADAGGCGRAVAFSSFSRPPIRGSFPKRSGWESWRRPWRGSGQPPLGLRIQLRRLDLSRFNFTAPVLVGGLAQLRDVLVEGMSRMTPEMLMRTFRSRQPMGFWSVARGRRRRERDDAGPSGHGRHLRSQRARHQRQGLFRRDWSGTPDAHGQRDSALFSASPFISPRLTASAGGCGNRRKTRSTTGRCWWT